MVAGISVRLNGPETSSRIGREARAFMNQVVRGETVICQLNGERTHDRWVGVCFLDGQDIGAIAVGHARYSGGRYRGVDPPAARSRIGRAGYC